jgi:hypothetical protein
MASASQTEPSPTIVTFGPSPDAGSPPATKPSARLVSVPVKLGDDTIELTTDPERMATLVETIFQLLGRSGLRDISVQVAAMKPPPTRPDAVRLPITRSRITGFGVLDVLRSPAVEIADLWHAEVRRLDATISGWFKAIEDRATEIVLPRLRASRRDVLSSRDRYFAGLAQANVLVDRTLPLRGGALTQRADELRTFLHDVAERRIKAQAAMDDFHRMAEPHFDRPPQETIEAAGKDVVEQIHSVHRFVTDAAKTEPLLYWLVDWEADPVIDLEGRGGNDAMFAERIGQILRRAWTNSWTVQDRVAAAPARLLATGEGTPEERLGDTLNDEDRAGPWRFPLIVAQALEDLGWADPSPQAASVSAAMAAPGGTWTTSFSFFGATLALSIASHVACPPFGVAVDVLIGTANLLAAIAKVEEHRVEYTAIFDQRQSIASSPEGREVAAAVAGVVTTYLSQDMGIFKALIFNLVPALVISWLPIGSVEDRP